MEACLEKPKANPEKMKASLEEMESAMDVFKERLDEVDTTDLETNREKSKTVVAHQEIPNEGAAVEEHQRTNLWTKNWLWDIVTHGKSRPGTMLYDEPLKDERSRRDDGQLKFNNGIRHRNLKEQLCQRNER
jgi:hypothetical protein